MQIGEDAVIIIFHHGGRFERNNSRVGYINALIDEFECYNLETLNLYCFLHDIKEMGYLNVYGIHSYIPGKDLSNGLLIV